MEVPVRDAKARVIPAGRKTSPVKRRSLIEKLQAAAREKAATEPCAARSQDFLYDEAGLPG
jgi:hypothetical protein